MSNFVLKLLALCAMFIDHVAEVFGWEGWGLFSFNSNYLRYIGRISYPVFAFCIITGWKHTSNKEKYFSRLALFSVISQIPFSMALYVPNMTVTSSTNAFTFRVVPAFLLVALIAVVSYWHFVLHNKIRGSLFVVAVFAILPAFLLKVNYMWLLTSDSLNVLYTLTIGFALLFIIEKIKAKSLHIIEYIWLIILAGLLLLAYGTNADYGIGLMGIVLIVALYFAQKSKLLQSGVVAIWGVIYYGLVIGNWGNAVATLIPAFLILMYNQKRGANNVLAKWFFYMFYPLHLLFIGLVNMFLKG